MVWLAMPSPLPLPANTSSVKTYIKLSKTSAIPVMSLTLSRIPSSIIVVAVAVSVDLDHAFDLKAN